MKFKTLLRLSGVAAIISAMLLFLLAISFIAQIFLGDEAMSASSILLSIARIFEVFAILGLYALNYQALGGLGLAGFCLMISGILIDLFPPTGRVLFTLGLLLFTIAYLRTRALPAWILIVWLLSSVLILVSSVLFGTIMLAAGIFGSGIAFFRLGTVLRRQSKAL